MKKPGPFLLAALVALAACVDRPPVSESADLSVATSVLEPALLSNAYAELLAASGGRAPLTWSLVTLPASLDWLQLDPASGRLSGTPGALTDAPIEITVVVTDANRNSASRLLRLAVVECVRDGQQDTCFHEDAGGCLQSTALCTTGRIGACNGGTGSSSVLRCGTGCLACATATADRCEGACRCGTAPACTGAAGTCCAAGCVDVRSDAAHCGGCGQACPASGPAHSHPTCAGSACGWACDAGFSECNGACVDLQNDAAHCGACLTTCVGACTGGACSGACLASDGDQLCSGVCRHLKTDLDNCGSCGHACPAAPVNGTRACAGGSCTSACNSGFTACGGGCASYASDAANCGSCGHACPAGPSHSHPTCGTTTSGVCGWTCDTGYTNCNGACVDLSSDAGHCGTCGTACAGTCAAGACSQGCLASSGDALCAGVCRHLQSDPDNCNGCGTVCPAAPTNGTRSCDAGTCKTGCDSGYTACNAGCASFANDAANCGSCGHACPAGPSHSHPTCGTSASGVCGWTCDTGYTDCNGACVDLQTDAAHCGTCATACAGTCSAGACSGGCIASNGQAFCASVCINLATDPNNCKTCGTVCPAAPTNGTRSCAAGACGFTCAAPFANCGTGTCINTDTSKANCGGCGRTCTGDVCFFGSCITCLGSDIWCAIDELCESAAACSASSCFVAGTPVAMADGTEKAIEAVAVDDEVLSWDEATGELERGRVLETLVHPATPALLRVNGTLVTTPEHRFFANGGWVRADALRPGDRLVRVAPGVGLGGAATTEELVRSLELLPGGVTTYNLEVARWHVYFAGGVLVHNIKK